MEGGTKVPALLEGKIQSRGLVRGPVGRVGKERQDPWPTGARAGQSCFGGRLLELN